MSKETLVENLRGYKSTPRHCEELCCEAANEIESLRHQLSELKGMREEVVHYQKEFHRTRDQLGSAQAKIDELMLEYCPDEMTKEQLDEWAKHQRSVIVPKEHTK